MEDRMKFEVTKLSNGITVYGRPTKDPFVYMRLLVPVGHIHNTNDVLPGTAHFLEHMACNRSAAFPELDSFSDLVSLNGGSRNADTSGNFTNYRFNCPSEMFESACKGLISQVFEPLLLAEDLQTEVSVISNERKAKSKWYPTDTEIGNYLSTSWKYDPGNGVIKIFGTDSGLESMNESNLKAFHENYFDPRAFIVVGGTYDLDLICRELSRFKTQSRDLPEQFEQTRWENKTYHEKVFSEETRFNYRIGGIVQNRSIENLFGHVFLGDLLTNPVHGTLYNWLRKELGWSYGVSFFNSSGTKQLLSDWTIKMPVNSREQVQFVRKNIHEKILRAISDQRYVDIELKRQLLSEVFSFQEINDSVKTADSFLRLFGRIITEEEGRELAIQNSRVDALQTIYEENFSPDVVGEFLSMPENS